MVKESPGQFSIIVSSYEQFESVTTGLGKDYVFRGQRDPQWTLLPSLFRNTALTTEKAKEYAGRHLARFKESMLKWARMHEHNGGVLSLGQLNEMPDDDWWAYGQHVGLETPLLDWSTSADAALFFAVQYATVDAKSAGDKSRLVCALNRSFIDKMNRPAFFHLSESVKANLLHFPELSAAPGILTSRYLAQSSVFSVAPTGYSVEDMVNLIFDGSDDEDEQILVKIFIPNTLRSSCLRELRKKGTSALTLFPDVDGVIQHCNMQLRVCPGSGEELNEVSTPDCVKTG